MKQHSPDAVGWADALAGCPARRFTQGWRQAADQVAHHAVDLVGADFVETLVNRLGPEARSWIALLVPVALKPPGKRHGTPLAEHVRTCGPCFMAGRILVCIR